jgi:HlyD family secretion protein
MDQRLRIGVVAVVVLALAAGVWWWMHRGGARHEITLFGNVDLRQVDLPFNNSDRIVQVLAQEGDHVRQGQVLARLDTSRLGPQLAQAEALAAAQAQVVLRMHNGSRPQEIGQARASAAAAEADALDAAAKYKRQKALWDSSQGRALSRQDLDDARTSADSAEARALAQQKSLELTAAGPRKEDVAQAEAQLKADEAQVALLKRQLIDADLVAPLDAIVRSRVIEPGEISSPQRTAFSLAIIDPKWVRAYVSEPDLGLVRPGEAATITVDSFPHKAFQGWVGFISPNAEFTPKTVQTEELRSSLVYEIRVFVKDPNDTLRLGMPATVHLPIAASQGAH